MTPELFTEQLKATCGSWLRSVVLYGSAAAGDHLPRGSDYNLLIIVDRLDLPALDRLAPAIRVWVAAGNPPPLLFTPQSLTTSADAFALEIADLKDSHRVLVGDDPIPALPVDVERLRAELEYELNGKLMQLRARYVLAEGHPDRLRGLMTESLSTFLVLARGALRLYESSVPHKKLDALRTLARHIQFEVRPFEIIERWKAGERVPDASPSSVIGEYLQAIETLAQAVDQRLHPGRRA